jgi:MFS family permease
MSYGIIGHRISKQYTILISFILLGVVTILIPIFNTFIALIPLAFIAGLSLSPVFIAQDTILHELVPEAIRGRIFSTREWILNLSFGLACVIIAELTSLFSKQHLLFVVGILVISMSLGFIIWLRNRLHIAFKKV